MLLDILRNHVWAFSAAKTDTQLKQMSLALIDPKTGGIRSFEDFKRQAQTIAGTHMNWLRTEYDTAVQGALMTAKWQNIQEAKHLYPYLQFEAVEDKVTSEICRGLDGTIAHVDSIFWKKYYPPVHFNCRSTVRQLTHEQAKALGFVIPKTDAEKMAMPAGVDALISAAEQLRKNKNGKNQAGLEVLANVGGIPLMGKVLNYKNSSYANISADKLKLDLKTLKRQHENKILALPREKQFISVYTPPSGGEVLLHQLVTPNYADPADDFWEVFNTATARAKQGYKLEIMPIVNAKNIEARAKIYIGLDNIKSNPDIRDIISGIYYDVKSPENTNKITKRANEASAQGAIPIITDFRMGINEADIERFTAKIFGDSNYKKDIILFFVKGKLMVKKRR